MASNSKNGGDLGFGATLWQAADKLGGSMDASEKRRVKVEKRDAA